MTKVNDGSDDTKIVIKMNSSSYTISFRGIFMVISWISKKLEIQVLRDDFAEVETIS